jgi:5-methylcytosine-specific restriction endonuclease McrA
MARRTRRRRLHTANAVKRQRTIKDADRVKGAEWRKANPERRRAAQARYRAKNPDKVREMKARWYKANRDKLIERAVEWQRANPECKRATSQKRRAAGRVSAADMRAIMAQPCAYCGDKAVHVDHVTPIARVGTSDVENLVAACRPCNLAKGQRTALEFAGLWPGFNRGAA